ncbi:MAG: PAS domain S-box protein [Bacteroidota bacterium]|nr:PAS domain S-box protein [Bacteroidota bacterium]
MTFKKTFLALSGVVFISILVLSVLTFQYNKANENTSFWVRHTLTVLDQTEQLISMVEQDGSSGLSPDAQSGIQRLKELTGDNPLQQSRIDSLAFFFGRLAESPQYLSRSRILLDKIRQEENGLLAVREASNSSSRHLLRNAVMLLLGSTFLLLVALFVILLYHLNRRKKAEKRLDEAEERLGVILRNVKDHAIFMIDPGGRVMSWNKGAEAIKGYAEQEVIGKPISIFYTEEGNRNGEPAHNLRKAAEEGHFETVGLRRRKDGSEFWAAVYLTALYDDDGKLKGFAKITRDITEQKRAEDEMTKGLLREKELNEMKSRFVSLASHEFKTPLSVILSSASLIEKYQLPGTEERRKRHVQRIKSNVSNLTQILNDFLSIEKLEGGLVNNAPAMMDFPDFVREIIQDLHEACKAGQEIDLRISGRPEKIFVDAHLLRNVLINLLSNAIKYSP